MELRRRKRIRLQGYDYSQPGYYFITICTDGMAPFLCRGEHCSPPDGRFPLSKYGLFIDEAIQGIGVHYRTAHADKYVIMPNHVHLILVLTDDEGRTMCAPTVPQIIKHMKEFVTKKAGISIWQKGFYDHVIRNERDYLRIWNYIDTNPAKWRDDCYFKEALGWKKFGSPF